VDERAANPHRVKPPPLDMAHINWHGIPTSTPLHPPTKFLRIQPVRTSTNRDTVSERLLTRAGEDDCGVDHWTQRAVDARRCTQALGQTTKGRCRCPGRVDAHTHCHTAGGVSRVLGQVGLELSDAGRRQRGCDIEWLSEGTHTNGSSHKPQ
jgi:hypothetical protein